MNPLNFYKIFCIFLFICSFIISVNMAEGYDSQNGNENGSVFSGRVAQCRVTCGDGYYACCHRWTPSDCTCVPDGQYGLCDNEPGEPECSSEECNEDLIVY